MNSSNQFTSHTMNDLEMRIKLSKICFLPCLVSKTHVQKKKQVEELSFSQVKLPTLSKVVVCVCEVGRVSELNANSCRNRTTCRIYCEIFI